MSGFEATAAALEDSPRGGIGPNGKPSLTIDQAAVHLARGLSSWSPVLGGGVTLTYAFAATATTGAPTTPEEFIPFSALAIEAAEGALRAWADVANITFVRVGSGTSGPGAYSNDATMLFGGWQGLEAGGMGNFPGDRSVAAAAGNVHLSRNVLQAGELVLKGLLLHETGHALGLRHPGEYGGGGFAYAQHAGYYEDSHQYSTMSYFGEDETGADFGGLRVVSPMLDDIAAIQRLYGPNLTTRTGDTVYGFNSNLDDQPQFRAYSAATKLVFAVWDAGGEDTFDFSGYATNQLIDLREGFFSNVGGLRGNVAVAQGVVIENAAGGSGADVIHGNAASNRILGGAGADTLDGGSGGSNYLRGDDGADSLIGGSGFDDINGNMGEDTAHGGAGDDWVVGGKEGDLLFGDDGADLVYGNLGADTCEGGAGADVVRGGQEADVLSGGAGDDWLSGDRGDDTMAGAAGADIFHTFGDAGLDRVTDFSAAEGDRVLLDPGTMFTVTQVGADAVIDMGGGGRMVLVGVTMGALTPGWIFGA